MPKWGQRSPIKLDVGRITRPKDTEVIVLDVPIPTPTLKQFPEKDSRVVTPIKPERHECLNINTVPTAEGISFDIINKYDHEYMVILSHPESREIYGIKTKEKSGTIPVMKVPSKRGTWTALLLQDNQVIYSTTFVLDLSAEWLAEAIGQADIRFSSTDGTLDRLGSIAVTPGPKGEEIQVSPTEEDFAVIVLFPTLPDDLDFDSNFIFEVHRPGSGGLYYRSQSPVGRVSSYRVIVKDHFPSSDPGKWLIRVLIGSKIVGRATFHVNEGGPKIPKNSEISVEEFSVSLVGGSG